MNKRLLKNMAFVLVASLLVACSKEEATPQPVAQEAPETAPVNERIDGECGTVHGGDICTWAKTTDGNLAAFGATVPLGLVENAPLDEEMIFPPTTLARIPVPAVVTEQTGVDHLGINWEVAGHPPPTFFTPHYDFHFYTQSGDDIEAIDCSDLSKPEVPPEGYILPDIEIPNMGELIGLCVPHMGMHAVAEDDYNAEGLFSATMITGYYQKKTIFTEPMIARDYLLARESFSLDLPALPDPDEFPSWPVAFKAIYDADADAFHLTYFMD
jgi:hypothetical protein